MRLHRLQVEAFGPFAQRVEVDFDALSAAGLFLLTGATGAGKTSILDAVCFALYGEVPGDRQSAKRLRADQAPDGAAPRVTLELTLAGRRFRILRSPAWQRPKKRGAGTTTEQASVRLSERRGETWQSLSTRLDEAGHQITQLVGLNLTQFCQVAMLPQGRFQAFLRARSHERHKLLQQVFRTARFEEVERWLAERRRALRRDSLTHHDVVADLVSRLSEAADSALPEAWDLHDLTPPVETGETVQWASARSRQAEKSTRACALREQDAATVETDARRSLEAAVELRDDQRRHSGARAERDRLVAAGAEHARQAARLDRARRAAGVAPLTGLAEQHAQTALTTRARSATLTETAATRIGVAPMSLDDLALVEHRDRAVAGAADARALLPREEILDALRAEVEDASARSGELAEELERLDEVLSGLPTEIAARREDEADARDAERALVPGRVLVDTLRRRREAAELALRLAEELDAAAGLHRRAIDDAQDLKEAWLQIQEQRIRGIAAELAGRLVVGDACPVCGSADHPRPASSGAGTPDAGADAEKIARRRVDDAEATRHAHDVRVRDLAARLAGARATADGELASIRDELAGADARLERLAALAGSVAKRRARVAAAEARQAELVRHREVLTRDLTVTTTSVDRLREEVASIESELEALLSGSGCDTLTALATHHDAIGTVCTEALLARDEARRAEQTAATVRGQLVEAALDAGFADPEEAALAGLDPEELDGLEREIRRHEQALARAEETLAEPGLDDRAALPPPDVLALKTQHEAAANALTEAITAAKLARGRAERVAGLTRELRSALDLWSPVRAEHELVTRMAALVEGTSADNRLRMRLSGYVLASRLAQVVSAANLRLTRMSDRRYTLEHTGGRAAGENRGGLSLLVRDEWSGEARDPATLSGGETFVVSLALALGLADVIAHEVGGAELDTLFVDEGFGSLDAETLDDVMDTLDTLREGGRVVGVVSHVSHLRERIPTQLQVEKRRHGSSVRTVRAG